MYSTMISGKAVQGSWFTNGGELHVWIQWLFVCLWSGMTKLHIFVPVEKFVTYTWLRTYHLYRRVVGKLTQ